MRSRKDKAWMVKWKLLGCPLRLSDEMLGTVPQEALYHTKTRLPLAHGNYIRVLTDKDGLICLQKWPTSGYRLAFTDDTGEEHLDHYNNWKEVKTALARILGRG